jgi:osmotically-inducible protein OsmY
MELPTMSTNGQAFIEHVERVVRARTSGQIRGLRVECFGGEVILSGRTHTYYTKQLATHAAMDAIEDASLTNAIEVE